MLEPNGQKVILEIVTRVDAFAGDVKRDSGLLIATGKMVQDEPQRGVVYAVSPEIKGPEIKVGDRVIFHTKEIFQGFAWDDRKLVAVEYDEIKGILTEVS